MGKGKENRIPPSLAQQIKLLDKKMRKAIEVKDYLEAKRLAKKQEELLERLME